MRLIIQLIMQPRTARKADRGIAAFYQIENIWGKRLHMANNTNDKDKNSHVTEYCVMCRRPDTSAGKMIHMPGNLCVCGDCMQKMMDFAGKMDISQMDFSKMTQTSIASLPAFQSFFDLFHDTDKPGGKGEA